MLSTLNLLKMAAVGFDAALHTVHMMNYPEEDIGNVCLMFVEPVDESDRDLSLMLTTQTGGPSGGCSIIMPDRSPHRERSAFGFFAELIIRDLRYNDRARL